MAEAKIPDKRAVRRSFERAAARYDHGAFLQREVGTTHRILAESTSAGRTEQFTAVRFATPVEPGSIVERTIAGHDGGQLLAA